MQCFMIAIVVKVSGWYVGVVKDLRGRPLNGFVCYSFWFRCFCCNLLSIILKCYSLIYLFGNYAHLNTHWMKIYFDVKSNVGDSHKIFVLQLVTSDTSSVSDKDSSRGALDSDQQSVVTSSDLHVPVARTAGIGDSRPPSYQ